MKKEMLVYSNRYYIGFTYDLFSEKTLEIATKRLKVGLENYSLEQYTKKYYSNDNSFEVIKISETLFKIIDKEFDFNNAYFYLSSSEDEILRQIKKERINSISDSDD